MTRVFIFVLLGNLVFWSAGWTAESLPAMKKMSNLQGKPPISSNESRQRLDDAMLLFKHGKTDAAIYMLQQLEKDDPTNHQVLLKLGEIAIDKKNWAYAIQVLRQASFLRPEDIEVRLILMNIYKAYQMPIQEIIAAKEILELKPGHTIANQRLADLYREQTMQKDEIRIRRKLKKLIPDDYKNLKRLAVIYDHNGQHWEAAKIYQQIRKHYPDKLTDMLRLAALYDKLGEAFREAEVLDHIEATGGGSSWMQARAEKLLRKQNRIYDPIQGGLSFKTETEPTMKVDTITSVFDYTRIRVRSSLDFGFSVKHTYLKHRGIDILDGDMSINNISAMVNAQHYWLDKNMSLYAAVGVSHDEVTGRLFGTNDDVTAEDFPFLEDPSFNSFGGTIPIAKVQLAAKPWLDTIFNLAYEHNLVNDLDARLNLFTFDRISAIAIYKANDKTEFQARIDNSFISDGNHRLHGLVLGNYTLWGSTAKYNYRGRRMDFLRFMPGHFVRLGYQFEYFKDKRVAEAEKYQTFIKSEYRHKGILLGQTELYSFATAEKVLASIQLSYAAGTTLDYQRSISARIFYYNPDFANEIGINYGFEDSLSSNTSDANRRIAGLSKGHQISLTFKWRF